VNIQAGGPVIGTAQPAGGTVLSVPAGIEVEIQIAGSYTVDPPALGRVMITDKR
jgi:hypothetical protein